MQEATPQFKMCVENLDEKNETGKEKMKLIYFKNWHKWKESGNSAMPKRSHKVLNLSEKLFTCRKKKKHCIYRVWYRPRLQASTRDLGTYFTHTSGDGDYCIQ